MNLNSVPQKQLNELERLLKELQITMKKAKLHDETLAQSLHQFELEVGEVRRRRFDDANPEYKGY